MKDRCQLYVECVICQQKKPNLDFQSDAKGRTRVKPYCKTCEAVYKAQKRGWIREEVFKGLNFDYRILSGNHQGEIFLLRKEGDNGNGSYQVLSLEKAKRWVKQGGAEVLSPDIIRDLTEKEIRGTELHQYVLERDNFQCFYCKEEGRTVDHVIPRDNGGLNIPANMVCSCEKCNREKSNLSLRTFKQKRKMKNLIKNQSGTLKRCSVCHVVRQKVFFEKGEPACTICNVHNRALTLGLITIEKLKTLNFFYFVEEKNDLMDKEGKLIANVSKNTLNTLIQHGIAQLSGDGKASLIYNEKEMKILYPQKSIQDWLTKKQKTLSKEKQIPIIGTNTKKKKIENPQNKIEKIQKIRKTKSSTNKQQKEKIHPEYLPQQKYVTLTQPNGDTIGKVSDYLIRILLKHKRGVFSKGGFKLNIYLYKLLSRFREYSIYFPRESESVPERFIKGNYCLYSEKGRFLKNIEASLALSLLRNGGAHFVEERELKLNTDIENLYIDIPELRKLSLVS